MTVAAELLSRCRALGIGLTARPDGGLTWEADAEPPTDLLIDLRANKADLQSLLATSRVQTSAPPGDDLDSQYSQNPRNSGATSEADTLLARLRDEVDRVRTSFGGKPPAGLAIVLADALVVGGRFVRDHEAEWSRGWDSIDLLRGLIDIVRELAGVSQN
jgi:hypothetical protein